MKSGLLAIIVASSMASASEAPGLYAKDVSITTQYVNEAKEALGPADGKCAEIFYMGNLDLVLEQPTDGKPTSSINITSKSLSLEEGPTMSSYDVLARSERKGAWAYIGSGRPGEPVSIGIKDMATVAEVRINYKNPYLALPSQKPYKDVIGIDSVELK